MKTLIVYSTSGRCTEKAVRELTQRLSGEIQTMDLKHEHVPDLKKFDRIVIGGSIQNGKMQQRINQFCIENLKTFSQKEIGLFICCSQEIDLAHEAIRNAFPEEIHQMAKTEAIFRGRLNMDEMSFVKRILVKRVALVRESVSNLDSDSISRFADRMEKTYHPFMFLV